MDKVTYCAYTSAGQLEYAKKENTIPSYSRSNDTEGFNVPVTITIERKKDKIQSFFVAPLKVNKSKNKFFILNLNNYRNAYYQTLNTTKKDFCRVMNNRYPEPIKAIPGQVKTIYTAYAGNRRAFDLPNVCSIVQKYFEDWLVGRGVLVDDSIKIIIECAYKYGGVDKDAPRVEVQIIT